MLTTVQKREFALFVAEQASSIFEPTNSVPPFSKHPLQNTEQFFSEIQKGNLYICFEQRLVSVCGIQIELTVKEFDFLLLLISNPRRVFTYEMITELIWKEPGNLYSRKTIVNHASNLRKKLMVSDNIPNYVRSIRGIGYRFGTE